MNEELIRQMSVSNPRWKGELLHESVGTIYPRGATEEIAKYLRDRQGTMEVGGVAIKMFPLWRLLLST